MPATDQPSGCLAGVPITDSETNAAIHTLEGQESRILFKIFEKTQYIEYPVI